MKFYIVKGPKDEVVGCETSLAKARKVGVREWGRGKYSVDEVLVNKPREALRKLLGGAVVHEAAVVTQVYPSPND